MKSVRFLARLAISVPLLSLHAADVTTCRSPDGKFALHCVYGDEQPYAGTAAIVDLSTDKDVFSLDPNWTLSQVRLLWSPDSKHVAYFFEKNAPSSAYNSQTRVFVRSNALSFNEIALPDLPMPKLPKGATGSEPDTNKRVEALQWTGPNDLLVEKESIDKNGGRGASKIAIAFDQNNSATIQSIEQERVSIIDYFLLLPPEDFEARPSVWLNHARTGGFFYLCTGQGQGGIVDEKNGYISVSGDGAQPSFEVALFRYRDGRPLLAFAEAGDPEAEEPLSIYLKFFELGADGKMHETKRSIFPIPDSNEDRWQFILPRHGRTIVVRAPKTRKIRHRFTWDGEKFQAQK